MKKLLVFLCAMSLVFCAAGAAQAYVYEYFSGEQWAGEGDSYEFFFDLVHPNGDFGTSPFTNSNLTFGNDEAVGWGALPMQSAYVMIVLWSSDPEPENTEIVLNAYYNDTSYVLFNGDMDLQAGNETFVFELVGDAFDDFAPNPWGEITISLGLSHGNDLYIHEVGIAGEPQPLPEPATMLLLGSGLVGLVSLGRKKFFRK